MLFCEEIDKKVQGSVLTHRSLFMIWPQMRNIPENAGKPEDPGHKMDQPQKSDAVKAAGQILNDIVDMLGANR